MADNNKFYVLRGDKAFAESMTKEQILEAIVNATAGRAIQDVDTGFVTTIKEQNKNSALKFWVGTSAEYNAIAEKENNCFYILSDETDKDDVEAAIANINTQIDNLNGSIKDLNTRVSKYGVITQFLNRIDTDVFDETNTFAVKLNTKSFPKVTAEILLNKMLQGDFGVYLAGSKDIYLSMYEVPRILKISVTATIEASTDPQHQDTYSVEWNVHEETLDLNGAVIGTQSYVDSTTAISGDYVQGFKALVGDCKDITGG